MANIRNLKKDINYVLGDIIEAVYSWEYLNLDKDTKKSEKIKGECNCNDNGKKIIGKMNGLLPVPGAFFNFKGESYRILKAEIGNGIGQAGEVLSDKLEIACKNNQSIKILEIQRQGKKPQKIGEFMLGSSIRKGSLLSNA